MNLHEIQTKSKEFFEKNNVEIVRYGLDIAVPVCLDEVDITDLNIEINDNFMSILNFDDNFFIAYNTANLENIVFFEVKEDKVICLDEINERYVHVVLIIEDNCNVKLIDNSSIKEKESKIVEIILKKNSKLDYHSLYSNSESKLITKRISVGENSECSMIDYFFGNKFLRVDTKAFLDGKNSSSKIGQVFLSENEEKSVIETKVYHNEGDTKSDMLIKGILKDNSFSVFDGLVNVKDGAKNVEGYQRNDVLLLNKNAEYNSIPPLEIDNGDVKCSHGATIGRINEDQLFYLMSRGLNKEKAKEIIVDGFLKNVIGKMDKSLRKVIENE